MQTSDQGKIYTIMNHAGGGARGTLSSRLGTRLHEMRPGFYKKINLHAGVSTGSILALAYALHLEAEDIFNFYLDWSPKIFKQSLLRKIAQGFVPKYSNKSFKDGLQKLFGKNLLKDLKSDVLVPTYYLGDKNTPAKPVFYSKRKNPEEMIWKVALKSCSAPTYFPPFENYIDGGLATNSPSAAALAEAQSYGNTNEQIKMLSVGTGIITESIKPCNAGITGWIPHLLDIFIQGPLYTSNYQVKKALGRENYVNIDPLLEREVLLDNVEDLDYLVNLADQVNLDPALRWVDRFLN